MKHYEGPPLEQGGTSIAGKESPAARFLMEKDYIKPDQTIIDYGAGKGGRNSVFFRDQGCKVYSYDPFNGKDVDGWKGVSNVLPSEKFDVSFCCYVLNVIPYYEEQRIVTRLSEISNIQIYVVRNDITKYLTNCLKRTGNRVSDFFYNEFGGTEVNEQSIKDFARFGTRTSHGFQRVPDMDQYDMNRIKGLSGYNVYESSRH